MQLKGPNPALLRSYHSLRRLLFSNIPTTASFTNRVSYPLSVSFEGYDRIEEANLHSRSKRLQQAMQEDVILFPDPSVRLSAIGDSAVTAIVTQPCSQHVWPVGRS